MNGATALMTITAAAGFAAAVQHTEAFNAFVGMLFELPFPPMIDTIFNYCYCCFHIITASSSWYGAWYCHGYGPGRPFLHWESTGRSCA